MTDVGGHSPQQLADHFRQLHFGGNWTAVDLQGVLADVDWQQANRQIGDCHSIVALVYHIHYFEHAVLQVLQGRDLDAHDRFSFDHPAIQSNQDWDDLLSRVGSDAEQAARLISSLPEKQLWQDFADPKFGSVYRNILGMIEHGHYHLGQIVILKRVLQKSGN